MEDENENDAREKYTIRTINLRLMLQQITHTHTQTNKQTNQISIFRLKFVLVFFITIQHI